MPTSVASIFIALGALAACSDRAGMTVSASTVVTVSDTAYAVGSKQTESKEELLRSLKAIDLHEPVVVVWSIRGGDENLRKLAQARAVEVREMLQVAGIRVSVATVGNEIFEAKP